jgi:hypothetical protein
MHRFARLSSFGVLRPGDTVLPRNQPNHHTFPGNSNFRRRFIMKLNRMMTGAALGAGMLLALPGLALAQAGTVGGATAGAVTGALIGGPVGAVVGGVAGGAIGTAAEGAGTVAYPAGPRRGYVVQDPMMARKWESCARLYPTFDPRTGTFLGADGLVHICQ